MWSVYLGHTVYLWSTGSAAAKPAYEEHNGKRPILGASFLARLRVSVTTFSLTPLQLLLCKFPKA